MAIVNWKDADVMVSSGTEADQELMIGILKLDTSVTGCKWEGKVICGKKSKQWRVELRKSINGTSVLVRIGFTDDMNSQWHSVPKERNMQISMNGKAHFLPEEIQEMNLAIIEAQNVLNNKNAL